VSSGGNCQFRCAGRGRAIAPRGIHIPDFDYRTRIISEVLLSPAPDIVSATGHVRSVPPTESCAAAIRISIRQVFDHAGLREFEFASALKIQHALRQGENANRSFFEHILKTVSCI
jgi:hypothetical protein